MPQQPEVTKALRFLRNNPKIPEKGIKFLSRKLKGTEEEEEETQKLLQSAYQYLQRKRAYSPTHPLMRNIGRLGRAIRK
jgi:hypothetical protein